MSEEEGTALWWENGVSSFSSYAAEPGPPDGTRKQLFMWPVLWALFMWTVLWAAVRPAAREAEDVGTPR